MSRPLAALLFTIAFAHAKAACDPTEFMARDVTGIIWSDSVRYAFLSVTNQEHYEDVRKTWNSGGSYGPISGYLNLAESRELASKDFRYQQLDASQDQFYSYLTNHLSPTAAQMYGECLRTSQTGPGIQLWVSKRVDDVFTVSAVWVGDQGQGMGKLTSMELKGGGEILSKPDIWPKGDTQELVLTKPDGATSVLTLKVSGQSKSLIFAKELAPAPTKWEVVAADNEVVADSGGWANPGCGAGRYKSVESCVQPKHGGYFVRGTVRANVAISGEGASSEITKDSFDEVCVRLVASTPACERYVKISGRASANEVYAVEAPKLTKAGEGPKSKTGEVKCHIGQGLMTCPIGAAQ
jgi:hypothetical protein